MSAPDHVPVDPALVEMPVDPALVERFRSDMERLLGRGVVPEDRIALAVSGGPDSMAMLVLAAAAFPGRVIAATVDHALRAEAAEEARLVADHARRIGVPHAILRIETPPGPRDNVPAWARARRYHLLLRWASGAGAAWLVTAHHADDQAETFLMRAARGSGVAGLAGIRARQRVAIASFAQDEPPLDEGLRDERLAAGEPPADALDLLRPLLTWRVAELRALVTEHGVPFVDDPSNLDLQYDRTRFRTLLQSVPWLDPVQIARSAKHAAEADATIREIEGWLLHSRRVVPDVAETRKETGDTQTWLDIADLPRELKRRLCRAAIHSVRAVNGIVRPPFDDSSNVESLLDALEAGKAATQAGIMVTPKGGVWRFTEQPPRRALGSTIPRRIPLPLIALCLS